MVRLKLEGSDIWEDVKIPSDEERDILNKQHKLLMEKVTDKIIDNINTIKINVVFEDESYSGKFDELQKAVKAATAKELETFLESSYIPYEDGYIEVSWN